MSIKDIVNVSITRQTKAVSRAGFGTAMILGTHKRFSDLLQYYSTIDGVLDVFKTTDPEYIAALAVFSQNPTVTRVAIGRRKTADNCVISVVTAVDNTHYEVVINGVIFDIDSGVGATPTSIATALAGAVNGGTEPITATDNLDGTFDLDADVSGVEYSVLQDDNLSLTSVITSQAIGVDLTDINNSQSDWYGLVTTTRVQSDVLLVAAWIETHTKIFGTASSDADIVDTTDAADTTTVAAVLKANNYARTFCIYNGEAGTKFPEAALFGKILTKDPGSYTAMFKILAGVIADDLSETQSTNALAKNCNIYEEIGGVDIVQEGKIAEGDYIDVIIFVDWQIANMVEGLYFEFVNLDKVPYTDPGGVIIENKMRASLSLGVTRGGLAEDPKYTVTVPKVATIPSATKATRIMTDIKFTGVLAGSIHGAEIAGVVSL